ncbi:uncharacterized protein DS421_7g219820 [Arachis hypogaea]|nr:uncharacterized protein DS421_7g219820 [Arachis hypogaea]
MLQEFEGMPYFDETISRLSVHGKQFEEGATLHGFGLTGEEETMYDSPKYTSFHSGTDIGCVVACGESIIEAKTTELVEQGYGDGRCDGWTPLAARKIFATQVAECKWRGKKQGTCYHISTQRYDCRQPPSSFLDQRRLLW